MISWARAVELIERRIEVRKNQICNPTCEEVTAQQIRGELISLVWVLGLPELEVKIDAEKRRQQNIKEAEEKIGFRPVKPMLV